MKKLGLIVFLLLPCFVYAQGMSLDLGVADFFMDTKIMEEGSIFNIGLGIFYNNKLGAEVRAKFEKTAKNEESDDSIVSDSLIAVNQTVYEIFLLPIQYRSKINENFNWRAGAGLYYEYQKSKQKGFIEFIPALELLGLARVNSYTDDLTMHLLGPVAEVGIKYNTEPFKINLSGGIIPVYFLTSSETQRMYPLFDTVNHSQNTWGSPYFYLGLESILFNYVCLAVNYNYAKLDYDVIGFDDDLSPIFPEKNVVSQSVMFEASVLIPFKSLGIGLQIGYGYMINFFKQDSGDPVKDNKQYFICSGKILSR